MPGALEVEGNSSVDRARAEGLGTYSWYLKQPWLVQSLCTVCQSQKPILHTPVPSIPEKGVEYAYRHLIRIGFAFGVEELDN